MTCNHAHNLPQDRSQADRPDQANTNNERMKRK